MNCKKCNHPQEANELFCKECGYPAPLQEQKEKVSQLKERSTGVLIGQSHSPLFLVFTICFSVMLLTFVASSVLGGIVSIISAILPLIFMIIATIGLWKSFAAKDGDTLGASLKSASIYDGYQSVMATISFIAMIVLSGLIVIALIISGSAAFEHMGSDVGSALILYYVIVIISLVAVIVVLGIIKNFYKSRREYFLGLKIFAETGTYVSSKAPVAGSIVIGAFLGISAIGSIFSSALMGSMIYDLFDMIEGMGVPMEELGDATYMLEGALSGMTLVYIVSGLANLASAAYYICSGIWLGSTHKALQAYCVERSGEEAKLVDLEKKTKAAVTAHQRAKELAALREKEAAEEAERQRQQEEEEERKRKLEAEEAERQRQREADAAAQRQAQSQQQMMMQMMMQQMMANSGMTPPTPVAVPTSTPSNDAKLLELQREKEAAEAKAKQAEEQQQLMMQMMQQMMEKMNNNSATSSNESNKEN